MRRFGIGDLHFNHDNLLKYCYRPENYKELIINNWRKNVKCDDIVYVLGDIIFSDKWDLYGILSPLPGTKILVRGNHDGYSDAFYMDSGFAFVADAIREGNILMTHKPVCIAPHRFNVHGHLHDISIKDWLEKKGEDYFFVGDRHFNVSAEMINYTPVLLEKLVNGYRKKE